MTTTKTISRKLLESTIADWEAARNEIPFGLGEEGENTLMALKFALAAHEQEPVAYMCDGEDGREYNGHNEFSCGGRGIPLYAHRTPSIPAAVPKGWKLVPTTATPSMVRAGGKAAREYLLENGGNSPYVIYEAMVAAAPKGAQ